MIARRGDYSLPALLGELCPFLIAHPAASVTGREARSPAAGAYRNVSCSRAVLLQTPSFLLLRAAVPAGTSRESYRRIGSARTRTFTVRCQQGIVTKSDRSGGSHRMVKNKFNGTLTLFQLHFWTRQFGGSPCVKNQACDLRAITTRLHTGFFMLLCNRGIPL